jgi:hypothetical protein
MAFLERIFGKKRKSTAYTKEAEKAGNTERDKAYKKQLYSFRKKQINYEAKGKARFFQKYKNYPTTLTGRTNQFADILLAPNRQKVRALYGQAPLQPYEKRGSNRFGYQKITAGTVTGYQTGVRGRPRGSYDKRYAAAGGVYNWRKEQAHRRQIEKMQALRAAAINPRQQAVLAQIEARQRQEQMAPENQTIPNTNGRVPLRSLHQEAEDAANLFP